MTVFVSAQYRPFNDILLQILWWSWYMQVGVCVALNFIFLATFVSDLKVLEMCTFDPTLGYLAWQNSPSIYTSLLLSTHYALWKINKHITLHHYKSTMTLDRSLSTQLLNVFIKCRNILMSRKVQVENRYRFWVHFRSADTFETGTSGGSVNTNCNVIVKRVHVNTLNAFLNFDCRT